MAPTTGFPEPPATLSALLTLALDDADHLDGDRYEPRADVYHQPEPPPYPGCGVCLAGMVMAATLRATPRQQREPANYPPTWERPLYAVDDLRRGRLVFALGTLRAGSPGAAEYAGSVSDGERAALRTVERGGAVAAMREAADFHDWADFHQFATAARVVVGELAAAGL